MEHSTNYFDTFIQVAEDCPAEEGIVPPERGEKKSIANVQFELLRNNPYRYTSDDLLFLVHAQRNDLVKSEMKQEREKFFSKGQACMRASPLTKTYGWGIHNDENGKIAIFGKDSEAYKKFLTKKGLNVVAAMRSKRKEK